MVRKKVTKDKKFVDSSIDQHKDFDDRLNLLEATLKNVEGSVQKIQASVNENKESTVGRKDPKRGFLRATFNIDKFPESVQSILKSKNIQVAGAAWHLSVYKQKKEEKKVLGVYLFREPGSSSISYDVDMTIRLLGSAEIIQKEASRKCYKDEKFGYGFPYLITWARLTNFTNGFVDSKGDFEMEVIFSVMGKTNTNVLLDTQSITSGYVKPDCILLVENRRFPVNKGFLSLLSSYFKALFFGYFRENNQEEIELKDVCAAEFLHLLEGIYMSLDIEAGSKDVIRDNVECLLRLADYYQVDIVTKRCEVYLKKCPISEVALEDKVLYAQDYRLPEFLDHCIKEFKTLDDVRKLRQSSQYSRLTMKNQLLIHENISGMIC